MAIEEYLQKNRELAQRLIGRRIVSATRLLFEPDDDEARFAWGPAVLELDDGQRLLFDCEESLSNVIVQQMPEPLAPLTESLASRHVRPPIATRDRSDPLHVALDRPITAIEAMSRDQGAEQSMRRYYEMCGWRIQFSPEGAVCIGTHLTTDCFPSTAFYLPDEVDRTVRFAPLAPEKRKLIRVGFYRELPHGDPTGASLREMAQPLPQPDEARIVSYLRAGKPFIITMGVARDVLVEKGAIIGAPHVLTDGVFAWPADLAHYVGRHHARVPADFVAHMAANAWHVADSIDMALLAVG